jgi:hypothetical protein
MKRLRHDALELLFVVLMSVKLPWFLSPSLPIKFPVLFVLVALFFTYDLRSSSCSIYYYCGNGFSLVGLGVTSSFNMLLQLSQHHQILRSQMQWQHRAQEMNNKQEMPKKQEVVLKSRFNVEHNGITLLTRKDAEGHQRLLAEAKQHALKTVDKLPESKPFKRGRRGGRRAAQSRKKIAKKNLWLDVEDGKKVVKMNKNGYKLKLWAFQ